MFSLVLFCLVLFFWTLVLFWYFSYLSFVCFVFCFVGFLFVCFVVQREREKENILLGEKGEGEDLRRVGSRENMIKI